MHDNIHQQGRAQYKNNECYQCGAVCLMGVCWNACLCLCGATPYHCAQEARLLPTQRHGPFPLPYDQDWAVLYCGALWCTVVYCGLDSPKHLGKPCSTIPGQSLPLENPGTARLPFHVTLQCVSIHYNAMHWIIQYGLLHFSLQRYSLTSCEAKYNRRRQIGSRMD